MINVEKAFETAITAFLTPDPELVEERKREKAEEERKRKERELELERKRKEEELAQKLEEERKRKEEIERERIEAFTNAFSPEQLYHRNELQKRQNLSTVQTILIALFSTIGSIALVDALGLSDTMNGIIALVMA
eukprot:14018_1